MKKIVFAILITVAVSAELLAGSPVWNIDYLILPDGGRLEGKLNYNWKAEVVQLRLTDGTVRACSAERITSFSFYDDAKRLLRKFTTVDLPGSSSRVRPAILEECALGHLSVYRRLRHTHELIKISHPSIYGDDTELVKDLGNFVYLVIDPTGQSTDLDEFNRTLWPQMSVYSKQLHAYINARQIDTCQLRPG